MNRMLLSLLIVGSAVLVFSQEAKVPDLPKLQTMTARFAPVEIGAELSALPSNESQVLARLVLAGYMMDALFLRQVWAGNEAMRLYLLKDRTSLGEARLHYFLINKGPWSRLDGNAPFRPNLPPKPAGANFYPPGASKAEIEAWLKPLSEEERTRATGFFTAIRRAPGN